METLSDQVEKIRDSSRLLVRQLGFLRPTHEDTGLPHSACHALIELDRRSQVEPTELAGLLALDKSSISRLISQLKTRGWVRSVASPDKRRRPLELTPSGRKKVNSIHLSSRRPVEAALRSLSPKDRKTVLSGIDLYARALRLVRRRESFAIRPIKRGDDAGVARVIRTVMPQFGACGAGFALSDPEVGFMSRSYSEPRHAYFVVVHGKEVVGGGGIGPLAGGDSDTCELRKMYFLPQARGLGLGESLLELCLKTAQGFGFTRCYLETLDGMHQARHLYEKMGFEPLKGPLGNTGHFGCNSWYLKKIGGGS